MRFIVFLQSYDSGQGLQKNQIDPEEALVNKLSNKLNKDPLIYLFLFIISEWHTFSSCKCLLLFEYKHP